MGALPNKTASGAPNATHPVGIKLGWPETGKYMKDANQKTVLNPDFVLQKMYTEDAKKAKALRDIVSREFGLYVLCNKNMKKTDGMRLITFPKEAAVGKTGTSLGTKGGINVGFQY